MILSFKNCFVPFLIRGARAKYPAMKNMIDIIVGALKMRRIIAKNNRYPSEG
jgi:hypothetical protein